MASLIVASSSTYLKLAALGGFAGAIVMALVMMGATGAAGLGATAMICAMAAAVLGLPPNGTPTSIGAGLALHLIDGIIIGVIVIAITLGVKRGLLIRNAKRGLAIGLLAGFVVWLVFGLPIMLFVMPNSMVEALSMMMPANGMTAAQVMNEAMTMLQGMMGMLAGVFLIGHLFFGAILGVVVGYGVSRGNMTAGSASAGGQAKTPQQFRCDTCGAAFNSQTELMDHAKSAHTMPSQTTPKTLQFKCQACGMTFSSQAELMEHAKKAHPMPAH